MRDIRLIRIASETAVPDFSAGTADRDPEIQISAAESVDVKRKTGAWFIHAHRVDQIFGFQAADGKHIQSSSLNVSSENVTFPLTL